MKKIVLSLFTAILLLTSLVACGKGDADVVSDNISNDAKNFKVVRRIVFVNGITNQYLLEIQGRCNIDDEENQLEVTCKLGDNAYKKHFLGLSDNVTYFIEQLESSDVSEDFYQVTFKPSTIIPDVDAR